MSEATWLSVKEAAERLGVPAGTVYDLARKSLIAHYRIGAGRGRLKFKSDDVAAYLESKRCGPKVKPTPARAVVRAPRPLKDYLA